MPEPLSPIRVISEPGGTHEGILERCVEHVLESARVGCWGIKMQWLSDAQALGSQRQALQYVNAYRNIAFPLEWHELLSRSAHKAHLQYGCSIYLPGDVDAVAPYVDFFKVSSFEANNPVLIRLMAVHEKPIYVSLGMCTEEEEQARQQSILAEVEECPVFFLYCVTGYPCPKEQLNLSVLRSGRYDGFSDHSADVSVGARAYAAGASIVEVHTRLSSTTPANADYAVALTYPQLRYYIQLIQEQQVYFGYSKRTIQEIEKDFLPYRSR